MILPYNAVYGPDGIFGKDRFQPWHSSTCLRFSSSAMVDDSWCGLQWHGTQRRSGWRNRSCRHSRGTRHRPIWCATMMAPTGKPSQIESGRWGYGTARSHRDSCPFRKSYPRAAMMQSTQDGHSNDGARPLDCSMQWRILVQW